jgi:hypothetical protein
MAKIAPFLAGEENTTGDNPAQPGEASLRSLGMRVN